MNPYARSTSRSAPTTGSHRSLAFPWLAMGSVLGLLLWSSPGRAKEPQFVRGDANADGSVDLSDAIWTLHYLFIGGPPLVCLDAADAGDSGSLDISDPIWILAWIFLGGPAPPSPSPSALKYLLEDCGTDPTPDALGCAAFPPCPAGGGDNVIEITLIGDGALLGDGLLLADGAGGGQDDSDWCEFRVDPTSLTRACRGVGIAVQICVTPCNRGQGGPLQEFNETTGRYECRERVRFRVAGTDCEFTGISQHSWCGCMLPGWGAGERWRVVD